MAQSTRPRSGNVPRNMTAKLLGCDEPCPAEPTLSVPVDQLALRMPTIQRMIDRLATVDRADTVDVIVAYEPHCVRSHAPKPDEQRESSDQLRRLGIIRGRQGIGFPESVHLERCAAPARILVTDSPAMAMLGALGMLAFVASDHDIATAISSGQLRIPRPLVLQVLLSGRLCPSVSTRDVVLELQRLGIEQRIASLRAADERPIVLEFSGPGIRAMSVWERAVLCSMAAGVGAATALAACDEKTDNFLRDQRRSKAYRQLVPDAGAPCSDAVCLDVSAVAPLVRLADGSIVPVSEAPPTPIREVIIGGEVSANLRDLLTAAAWFKTKRISPDVDVVVAPATHQVLEAMAATGTLAQLLSVGARLVEPDARLLTGEWHPAIDGQSLRSFMPATDARTNHAGAWHVASLDTLCISAIAGMIQDPRTARKISKATLPRELPIDDSLLFDRKPNTSTTILPPPRSSEPPQSLPAQETGLAL